MIYQPSKIQKNDKNGVYLIGIIKERIKLLANPEKGFKKLLENKFETSVADYLKLLGMVALLVGFYELILNVLKSAYFDVFRNLGVNYWFMLNYTAGRAISIMFLYLFSGTFMLFFLSIVLKSSSRRIKYTKLLQVIFLSLTPVLIFGWINQLVFPLIIWCIFLFFAGIRFAKETKIAKNSIERRD